MGLRTYPLLIFFFIFGRHVLLCSSFIHLLSSILCLVLLLSIHRSRRFDRSINPLAGGGYASPEEVGHVTTSLRRALHETFRRGEGTRDMSGPTGLTTEQFVDKVATRFALYLSGGGDEEPKLKGTNEPDPRFRRNYNVDRNAVKDLFVKYDTDGSGSISIDEFEVMLYKLGVAPQLKSKSKSKEDETEIAA